ncbi:MAG: nucleoside hydrolase [Saprospiraceae bacterium]
MRHFLIDTDTASDDAVALVMALQQPDIQVEAITIVAGNTPIKQAVQNALYTVELCGKNTPVYEGIGKPIFRALSTAQFVHGEDGMGDVGLNLQGRTAKAEHAVDIIIDTINRFPNEIELITIGPLTNIATAIIKNPDIVSKVKSCVIMGGVGRGEGNITPVSEYNIWADPEAAHIVFHSGLPIKMVGWDVTLQAAYFDLNDAAELKAIDTLLADFTIAIQFTVIQFTEQTLGKSGFHLPDPIAMAIAIDETISTKSKKIFVDIARNDDATRGQTIVDINNVYNKTPNVEVVFEASRDRFVELLKNSLV